MYFNRRDSVCYVDAMDVVTRKVRRVYTGVETFPSLVTFRSPLQHLENISQGANVPSETTPVARELPQKRKHHCHESVINLIKHEKDPQLALQFFNKVTNQKGFNHNHNTYAIILHKLARCKKYELLDAVLHQMTYDTCKFHEGIFLNLMMHFSKSSMHERVLEMFHRILPIVRAKPSLKAISTCLNLLVDADQIEMARAFLLNTRKDFDFEPNTCIFNILVKHHCKKGDLGHAFEVAKEMEKSKLSCPNLITYSTLINGLCASGRLEEAIGLFEEMVSKHHILPDALTYNLLINGFCRSGKTDGASKIMKFMKKNGCSPNLFNYSSLMNGFCQEGRLEEAKETLVEMKGAGLKPDTVVYTTLINYFCRARRTDEAIELLEEMKRNECRPDVVTMNVILRGLCEESRSNEAITMLMRLPVVGIYLNKASYRIVLNCLCKEGESEKAVRLLDLMLRRGFLPHFCTSNELIVHLCKTGKVNDAAIQLSGLVEMGFEPDPDTWSVLIDLIFRERKLLPAFRLLDELLINHD
ncbi:uncharacterized protein [Primulina huaijiensis]|uniref:uncharacterized protein n=1 Tax=Primulina huaijiensis TaxID=1492673 RepID=UPI003CC78F90